MNAHKQSYIGIRKIKNTNKIKQNIKYASSSVVVWSWIFKKKSIYIFIDLIVCLCVCVFVCLFVCLFIYLFIYDFMYLCMYLLCVCLFVCLLEIACTDFWYGEECNKTCNCRYQTEVCDKRTGRCTSGCPDGRIGAACEGTKKY